MPATEDIIHAVKDKPIQHISLDNLILDPNNPRFAEHISEANTQLDITKIAKCYSRWEWMR